MRRILFALCLMVPALALALLPAFAFAQVPAPKQWPLVGETRDFMTGKHGTDDAGHRWAAWRYLDANGFGWVNYTAVLRRDKVLALTEQRSGETPSTWATRMWLANSPLPCSDTAISSICQTAAAQLATVPPPEPPAFVVAKNGTSLTRPAYAFDIVTKTVGVQLASVRAPVGADCACWAYGARKNGTAYCVWVSPAKDSRADQVTACSKR